MPTVDLSVRIKNIQKNLNVPQTGTIDMATCLALETALNITLSSSTLAMHIKAVQKGVKTDADGIVGPGTLTAIEAFLSTKLPAVPAGASMAVSKKSMDMLIGFEVSSKETYTARYQSPIWPGGKSGVTIGIGYDLGVNSKQDIINTWSAYVSAATLDLLTSVAGKTGDACKALAAGIKQVKIPYDAAQKVFYSNALPSYARRTKKSYPGIEKLPPDAQGAILSLVYNRGAGIDDTDRRKEMKAMVALVAKGDIKGIAAQFRSMKRLWNAATEKGIINRRESEAQLVENATFNILPDQIILV